MANQSERQHDDAQVSSQAANDTGDGVSSTGAAGFSMPEKKQRKVTPVVIALIVVLVLCLAGGIAGGMYLVNTYSQIRDIENSKALEPTLPKDVPDGSLMKSPIDFATLQSENPDIYAWIYLPSTDINYPICQSPSDMSYYLTHDASNKESQLGAIFTEYAFNNKNFQDPVTIVYGHNGFGDTMFTSLHNFESSEYFNDHDLFYIYTPDHVYTYKVISSFMSDGNHLMGAFNFQSADGFAQFVNYIEYPNVVGAITRPGNVQADSKLVVLSTCNSGGLESVGRYLVCGVMVDDQSVQQ